MKQVFYITQFHDYQSFDGFYRKYRAIFIGGQVYPYHLAISPHWMVHHQTANMAEDPLRQSEEMAFLQDPVAFLGKDAWGKLDQIAKGLNLDYAGVDFTLLETGEILVFEANATMLVHKEQKEGPFHAKNPFIQNIILAFQDLLRRRACCDELASRSSQTQS